MWFLILGIIIFIVFLIYFEYINHDCINGKPCTQRSNSINPNDSIEDMIINIESMINSNVWTTFWRQSLLIGLIVSVPVIYFITRQEPTLLQVVIVVLLVSIGCFFSQSWIFTHMNLPLAVTIEDNLRILSEKIEKLKNQ